MSIHSSENFSDARGPGRHAWCGLLLAIVPGFGQFYHRQWLKGLVFLVLLSSFLGIFYDFLREGLWGLYTLGEEVPRDNSIFLLAEGIISVLIVAFGVLIYFLSLRDAWLNGKKRDEGIALNSVRKQYQMLLSDGFPYLMITPGFILLVFVVIFPILFGFAIAFTNYNLYHTPPAKLVDWVGLKNFINIFTLSIWRSTFLDVLQWTVVWTLLATTLQCTVGVLLAILVNQKDLRFKPLIRTITLPLVLYAIAPIIITQYTFNFNNFNIIYLFNNGGPAVAGSNAGGTDILVSWIYKLTMSSSQYAIAATITILLSIFVVGLALWQFRATKSFKNDDMA
ncbi:carbohydrate ABC transporter permease [Klebsiella pneumoniae]